MAKRLCFFIENEHVIERYVDFNYVKGLAFSQKVKCALSLQNAIINQYPKSKPIEISSKSSCELGKNLSAFSLKLDGRYIESIFQSSKVFSESGQLEFLKDYSPRDAKHYVKENGKGNIICFSYEGVKYPIYPESAF